jgi:hypothetical protein
MVNGSIQSMTMGYFESSQEYSLTINLQCNDDELEPNDSLYGFDWLTEFNKNYSLIKCPYEREDFIFYVGEQTHFMLKATFTSDVGKYFFSFDYKIDITCSAMNQLGTIDWNRIFKKNALNQTHAQPIYSSDSYSMATYEEQYSKTLYAQLNLALPFTPSKKRQIGDFYWGEPGDEYGVRLSMWGMISEARDY